MNRKKKILQNIHAAIVLDFCTSQEILHERRWHRMISHTIIQYLEREYLPSPKFILYNFYSS